MVNKCAYPDCKSRCGNEKVATFLFPKDTVRRNLWISHVIILKIMEELVFRCHPIWYCPFRENTDYRHIFEKKSRLFESLSLLRCGPDNNRTKEKKKNNENQRIKKFDFCFFGVSGFLDLWISGLPDFWICGCMDVGNPGFCFI